MPNLPSDICTNIDIDNEGLIKLLLISIALEEISLSHILNAEGELMQLYIKKFKCGQCVKFDELIKFNRSISETLRLLLEKEKTLKDKLINVINLYDDIKCIDQFDNC